MSFSPPSKPLNNILNPTEAKVISFWILSGSVLKRPLRNNPATLIYLPELGDKMKKLIPIVILVFGCDYAPTEHTHDEFGNGICKWET